MNGDSANQLFKGARHRLRIVTHFDPALSPRQFPLVVSSSLNMQRDEREEIVYGPSSRISAFIGGNKEAGRY